MRTPTTILLLSSLGRIALSATVKRAEPDRSNVVTVSKITDPAQQCAPYWYPPSDNYSNKFPPTWTVASIVSGDTVAQNKWNSIKAKIPAIAPKGVNGDFSSVNYDYGSDPDCWWTATQCVTSKRSGIPPDVAKIPEPLSAGYGFDDGPNCSHNALYDFLNQNNQKATVFYIGSNVINWPLQAQRALYDGHEICAHSWSHNAMTSLTSEQAFAEIWYTVRPVQAIKSVVGVTPTCWRPPYGDTDDRIRAIVNALGLTTVLWQYDSFDWMGGAQVDTNYGDFLTKARSGEFNRVGTIFLQHENNEFGMSKIMQYYSDMKSVLKLVPVGVAMNKTRPYVETNIEFPTYNEYMSGTTMKPLPASALSFLGVPSSTASSTSATASTSKASTTTTATSGASVTGTGTSTSNASSSSASGTKTGSGASTPTSSNTVTFPVLPANATKAQIQAYVQGMKTMFDSLLASLNGLTRRAAEWMV
ncbi:hypothetical protein E1B28_001985 [Marasmius oreades]|uniref:chitin deacetylase n=1 Tax=Marasmius oreades TaxID=181124 RepID=A0A9P7V4H4_9AGAR|nr:uncharacterized protein E1B28_001985 [Marasmius oreades]KAG7100210.1 hypothetical protein E1B28_001985 [Marasmius oreades]